MAAGAYPVRTRLRAIGNPEKARALLAYDRGEFIARNGALPDRMARVLEDGANEADDAGDMARAEHLRQLAERAYQREHDIRACPCLDCAEEVYSLGCEVKAGRMAVAEFEDITGIEYDAVEYAPWTDADKAERERRAEDWADDYMARAWKVMGGRVYGPERNRGGGGN